MFFVGCILFFAVCRKVSWSELGVLLSQIGWGIIPVMLVYPAMMLLHTADLQVLLPSQYRSPGNFTQLYFIRTAGDSINKITPFLDVGGEPLKIFLMIRKAGIKLSDAVAAIIVSRVGFIFSEVIFISAAWFLMLGFYPYPAVNLPVLISLIMSVIYLGSAVMMQMRGAVKLIPRVAPLLGIAPNNHVWDEVDLKLRRFYAESLPGFVYSVFWQFTAWVFGSLEVYLFFKALGADTGIMQALIFQAMLQSVKTLSFMIPGNLGAQEGGLGLIAMHFGYTATDGFALSLVKRFRQIVWLMIGMMIWKLCLKKQTCHSER